MAEYPTRQFSASNAYNAYMQSLEDEEERKKAYNLVNEMHRMTNPHHAGSAADKRNLAKISKLGAGTSSGLATRLRLMTAADKENLGVEFTKAFQDWFTENPDATMEEYKVWANKQGPWFDEIIRGKLGNIVLAQVKEKRARAKEERDIQTYEAGLLKEDEKDAVDVAANALSNKYAGRFLNQGADIQQRLIADMQREIDDSDLPSELKSSVFTETIKILKAAYGGYGEVQKTILDAQNKVLEQQRAERKWKLGDKHPDQWWEDTKAAMIFRQLMEATKDIDTDFERTQKIFELKREALVQGTFSGVNEDELDSLLASAGFPVKPFTSTQYNQFMERKQLIAGGRFEDAYQMYNREFSQDPAFERWSANAREAGIFKIMSGLVPDWSENSRELTIDWESFRKAELLDEDGNEIEKAERDKKTMAKLEELASKYNVSTRFIYWALTQNRQDVWGIGATVMVDI